MISRERIDESTLLMHPEEVLDNDRAHQLRRAIMCAQSEGYRYIILNLSGLEYISSAVVGSIISSVQASRRMGGDIVLCCASEKILHILGILGLCEFLTIAENEEAARSLCPSGG